MRYNVQEYGASGQGGGDDTAAIRSAIGACRGNGGGEIVFPAGRYASASLQLFANMTLHLEAGAVLSELDRGDFERHCLIWAEGSDNIEITGPGMVKGLGETADAKGDKARRGFRTGVLYFQHCTGLRLDGFTIRDGDCWTVHLLGCANVFVRGLGIHNHLQRRNNDGIDINSCRNVHISDCHIEAWDDSIVLKTKLLDGAVSAEPCENVVVSNCTLVSGCTALKIGSESKGDFRDIHFSNCSIQNSSVGFGIFLLDGGTVERVTCSNLSIELASDKNVYRSHGGPHEIHIFPFCVFVDRRRPESRLGVLRDLSFSGIHAAGNHGGLFAGHPESPIENLTLRDVGFRARREVPFVSRRLPCLTGKREEELWGNDFAPAYLNFAHVLDLGLEGVRVCPASRDGTFGDWRATHFHSVKATTLDMPNFIPLGNHNDSMAEVDYE